MKTINNEIQFPFLSEFQERLLVCGLCKNPMWLVVPETLYSTQMYDRSRPLDKMVGVNGEGKSARHTLRG
jgi:hypothetical protein